LTKSINGQSKKRLLINFLYIYDNSRKGGVNMRFLINKIKTFFIELKMIHEMLQALENDVNSTL